MSRLLPIIALALVVLAAGAYFVINEEATPAVSGAPELIIRDTSQADPRVDQLLQRIEDLETRLAYLEAVDQPTSFEQITPLIEEEPAQIAAATLATGQTAPQPQPLLDGLIAAGLEPYAAEQLARAQGEVELRRLELRDKAIREGYIGDNQFREEMRELSANEVNIRSEVSEDIYDRYLFHTGQPNRLQIESVILGSAAEDIGLEPGDYLVSYEDQKLFDWNDLRGVTSAGERGELVDLRISRAGSDITLSIPRGPMGVRLNTVRIDPDG